MTKLTDKIIVENERLLQENKKLKEIICSLKNQLRQMLIEAKKK